MKKLYFLFFLSTMCSCNFSVNSFSANEEVEKEQAEAVAAKLYWYTQQDELKEIPKLFGTAFYKENNKEALENFLKKKKEILGNFKDFNLKDWKTTRIEGTNPISEYVLIYEVSYDNKVVIEKINMRKEEGGVKIIGYYTDL